MIAVTIAQGKGGEASPRHNVRRLRHVSPGEYVAAYTATFFYAENDETARTENRKPL